MRSLLALLALISVTLPLPLFAAAPQGMGMSEPKPKAAKPEEKKEAEPPAPRISLSEITGGPGAGLMVPLYYTPDPNQPVRALTVEIDYVGNHLKFQKVATGVLPDDMSADISGTATDGPADPKSGVVRSKLRVSVALKDKTSPKGLPEGLLAFLMFTVTLDAKPFTIKLNPTVISAEDARTPPKKMAKINTVPGTVKIGRAHV